MIRYSTDAIQVIDKMWDERRISLKEYWPLRDALTALSAYEDTGINMEFAVKMRDEINHLNNALSDLKKELEEVYARS